MYPELNKSYAPQAIEPRWAETWIDQGFFRVSPDVPEGPRPTGAGGGEAPELPGRQLRPMWSLVIPPPNVTGSLHMGHMLEHTLIDMVVRWRRMQGHNTLWLPGTDHAGIATQMVVERALAERGLNREAMGREAFELAVWDWKRQSGDRIKAQMIRLGTSCDWSRERFTLDEGLSRAVREVFVRLYEEDLIYRGRYIVNWCPRCLTAVSDLEVTHADTQGKLYRVKYPVAGRPGEFLLVATTRPETIPGDVAVAVNPADARYQHLIGAQLEVPLGEGRRVTVIADEIAQLEFGTGAVKITPAHDANDFAAGLRHNLEQRVVIDERGRMTAAAGSYAGLDRFAARKRFVADLEAAGLLAAAEDYALAVGQCQRCSTVIEPRISTQWFVKIAPLARDAVRVVEEGKIRFVPENNARIYFEWMANIHDWCISRQLWWGHRIPAWYCDRCNEMVVAREAPAACAKCGDAMHQDTDVLDTWFSSGLWPFSTMGWPQQTADLKHFYPTSLLVTGFDILFFWVARMIMLGIHFTDDVPFRQVYIHALVRDAERQKMSKTKGNVIDPLVVTEKYGTDAVRFTLAAMAAPGTDIALSEDRMAGYAAFANKIWNAARFIFLHLERLGINPGQAPQPRHAADRWIFSRLNAVAEAMNTDLEAYRFHDAAGTLYHFFWHEFCDWYLELAKLRLSGDDAAAAHEAGQNLWAAFDQALRLLHPVMPFVTEEIWQGLWAGAPPRPTIALAEYPQASPALHDATAESEVERLQVVVTELRRLRSEARVLPRTELALRYTGAAPVDWAAVQALARIGTVTHVPDLPPGASGFGTAGGFTLQLDLAGTMDPAAERARLEKERAGAQQALDNARRQLASESFLARAPQSIIDGTKRRAEELEAELTRINSQLEQIP